MFNFLKRRVFREYQKLWYQNSHYNNVMEIGLNERGSCDLQQTLNVQLDGFILKESYVRMMRNGGFLEDADRDALLKMNGRFRQEYDEKFSGMLDLMGTFDKQYVYPLGWDVYFKQQYAELARNIHEKVTVVPLFAL